MGRGFLRLNTFQCLMRQWRELAPYNAGTLLHMEGVGDKARWESSIQRMVDELGLGQPRFEAPDLVSFSSVGTINLETTGDLEAKTSEELNRPYNDQELPM